MLAMVVKTGEPNFVGNVGLSEQTRAFIAYHPESDQYVWFKVFSDIVEDAQY